MANNIRISPDKTFLGNIKPVGSKILINFNLGEADPVWIGNKIAKYRFRIENNYIVTGASVTKTVADVGAEVAVTVLVQKIDRSGNIESIMAEILQPYRKGEKYIAGVPLTGAPARNLNLLYTDNSITAEKNPTAGASNADQEIQVSVIGQGRNNPDPYNPDCFIEIQLANFNNTTPSGEIVRIVA